MAKDNKSTKRAELARYYDAAGRRRKIRLPRLTSDQANTASALITVPLLRSMPPKTALDLMMTGRRVGAEEGQRLGFVQRVVPVAELDATVDALAQDLAAKSPLIMRWGRDSFYRVLELDADAALTYLQGMLTITSSTEDAAEGVTAFAEKRAPEWKGR